MAEERFTSQYDGTTQDNLLKFAENVKNATTVDGAETVNVQGFTLPRISDISGFVAVNNAGNAIGFMSKEQVASVLGELIGIATPLKNGLMSKDGFILRGALTPPNWNDLRLFDDQIQSGIHLVAPSDGSSWGILIVFCGSLSYGGCFQNLYRVDSPPNYRFLMNNNEWSEWKAFS